MTCQRTLGTLGLMLVAAAMIVFGPSVPWAADAEEVARSAAVTADQDAVSVHDDPVSRPARLFIASVIGRDAEERRRRAQLMLDKVAAGLAETPDDPALRMLRVAALGTVARAASFTDSVTERYGSRSRDALEALEALVPDHPWTWTFRGVWHVEVKRRGGFVGAAMLGASVADGMALLDRATKALGRNDPAVPYAYAIVLLSYDAEEHAAFATTLLKAAASVAAKNDDDPAAVAIRAPIQRLLDLLAKANYDAVTEVSETLL
jgi:hypothetical protein